MDRELNERIAKYRKQNGFTQEQLGAKLKMKTSTYSQFERRGSVDSITLKKLAEIFNVDVRLLLYGEFPDKKPPIINQQQSEKESIEPEVVTSYQTNFFQISVMEMLIIENFRRLNVQKQQEIADCIEKAVKEKFKRRW